jgi:ribosomal protein S3
MKQQATLFIHSFFASLRIIVGIPNYKVMFNGTGGKKMVIQIPYYESSFVVSSERQSLTEAQINALGTALTQIIGYTCIELRLVRLQYPHLDSSILAQFVALNAGKYNFTRLQKQIFDKVKAIQGKVSTVSLDGSTTALPSTISGVKLELAGRLTTQRSIPRKTVENGHIGSFQASNMNFNQYASKNKIGAFNIKV